MQAPTSISTPLRDERLVYLLVSALRPLLFSAQYEMGVVPDRG